MGWAFKTEAYVLLGWTRYLLPKVLKGCGARAGFEGLTITDDGSVEEDEDATVRPRASSLT